MNDSSREEDAHDQKLNEAEEECSCSQSTTERLSSSSDTSDTSSVAEHHDAQQPQQVTTEDKSGSGAVPEKSESAAASSSSVNDKVEEDETAKDDSESKNNGRKVSFKEIEIREYPRCLGDNPSCTFGPPLSIGWRPLSGSYKLDLDQYENYKDGGDGEEDSQQQRRRRTSAEFQLPWNLREQILREECAHDDAEAQEADTACTAEEIQARIQEIRKAKRQRQASYAMQEFEAFEIFLESARRKLRRLACCSSSKARITQEDSLIDDYTPKPQVDQPSGEHVGGSRAKYKGQTLND